MWHFHPGSALVSGYLVVMPTISPFPGPTESEDQGRDGIGVCSMLQSVLHCCCATC